MAARPSALRIPAQDGGPRLGATPSPDGRCEFQVWAPFANAVCVHLLAPRDELLRMERGEHGYFSASAEHVGPGALYLYQFENGPERPDPASRFQPHGVHGPSQVVAHKERRDPGWRGIPLREYILYEIHIGTFTPEGTFESAAAELDRLVELGVTAVEIMPVAQFPGARNWGYDGVYPFAVQDSYGGPEGLRKFVRACHERRLAAILDVVYNHLGPEGNYLGEYAPYFTDRHRTPWGRAMNFDGPESDEVRRYFRENALMWVREFEFDALRLDAVHAIHDESAIPFLRELSEAIHAEADRLDRRIYVIGESDLNDVRVVESRDSGGLGLDAQWSDDFHHALHALLTREREGYYQDFGEFGQLAKAVRDGFVYTGEYSPARRRRHGNSTRLLTGQELIVSLQNHDQIGNRMMGERLGHLVSFEASKLAAGALLVSPYIPLLFMGEEYGETAPFQYFVSHSDENLIAAVRNGRREEFAEFRWKAEPPDPLSEQTFGAAKLNPALRTSGQHAALYELYRELIRIRKGNPALARLRRDHTEVTAFEKRRVLTVRRQAAAHEVLAVLHLGGSVVEQTIPVPPGSWNKLLDTSDTRWDGPGGGGRTGPGNDGELQVRLNPTSFVLLERC